jgi:argininosuccinate lyase
LQGFISSSSRDEILNGLERIEKDIGEGKFKWRNNIDVRTNIFEALIEIVGAPAKRLDSTISHYAQQLTVVQIWCYDSIDKVIAQIEELQVFLLIASFKLQ